MKNKYYLLFIVAAFYIFIESSAFLVNNTYYKNKIKVTYDSRYFQNLKKQIQNLSKDELLNISSVDFKNKIIDLKYYELSNLDIKRDFLKYFDDTFSYTPYRELISNSFSSKNLNINEYGFRGTKFSLKKKNPKDFRILMFGSSALFGWPNSSDNETISSYLQDILNKKINQENKNIENYEVLNLSVKSYNAIQDYINYLIVSQFIEHDMVIIYNGHNDFNDGFFGNGVSYSKMIEKQGAFKDYYDAVRSKNHNLFFKQGFYYLNYKVKKYLQNLFNFTFRNSYKFLKNIKSNDKISKNKNLVLNGENSISTRKSYGEIIEKWFKLLASLEKDVVYIHQVNLFATNKEKSFWEKLWTDFGRNKNFYTNFDLNKYKNLYLNQMKFANNIAEKNKTKFINIENKIKYLKKDVNIFFDHTHLTNKGNRFVAQEIANLVLKY